jgi:hypothetical protein
MRIVNGLGLLTYALNNLHTAMRMLPEQPFVPTGANTAAASRAPLDSALARITAQLRSAWDALAAQETEAQLNALWNSLGQVYTESKVLLNQTLTTFGPADYNKAQQPPDCLGMDVATERAGRILQSLPDSARPLGSTVALANGVSMPRVAFGTAHLGTPNELFFGAARAGYRHFDLAQGYGDMEIEFGRFTGHLQQLNLTREDLFVTSKVSYLRDFGAGRTRGAVLEALERTRAGHFDLMLLHSFHFNRSRVLEAWHELEQLYNEGKLKAIGVRCCLLTLTGPHPLRALTFALCHSVMSRSHSCSGLSGSLKQCLMWCRMWQI